VVDSKEIKWQQLLKMFQSLKSRNNLTGLQVEISSIIIGFQIDNILCTNKMIIAIGFDSNFIGIQSLVGFLKTKQAFAQLIRVYGCNK